MKKIGLLLSIMLLPALAIAQKSPIDKLFDKYYGKEGFTTVLVNREMFEVVSHMEKEQGEVNLNMGNEKGNLNKLLGNVNRVRVIAQEDDNDRAGDVNFMEELKGMDFDAYKELVVVKEADQEVRVLAKEEGGKLAELLVLVGGEDNVMVCIEGSFTMEDLESLSELDGLDTLGEILD